MMPITPKAHRVLALAPTTRGLGFAVLEGSATLVDWGVKSIQGDKNAASLAKTRELIKLYKPGSVVLEDDSAPESRRAGRIKELNRQLSELASEQGVPVMRLGRQHVGQVILGNSAGTKHELAEVLAQKFPHELGNRLPPRRRPWMSQDYRMAMFDAVALAVAFRARKSRA